MRYFDPSGATLRWQRYTVASGEFAVLDMAPSTAAHVKSEEYDFLGRVSAAHSLTDPSSTSRICRAGAR
jgi:hypothetical protein